jgi:hypothetical protein
MAIQEKFQWEVANWFLKEPAICVDRLRSFVTLANVNIEADYRIAGNFRE